MPSSEPIFWPLQRLLSAFRSQELSPVELAEQAIARIETFDPQLRSYLSVSPELALEQAKQAEKVYGEGGGDEQQLLGLPISIKDLFDVKGQPTSLGSLLYRDNIAAQDSQPVERLRAAGAVFLGKSNTAEFGQSATTENLMGDGCANPWCPDRTAGGSSGGAASSVGAGLASIGLGSDGGGSIRIPSAMSGLFGLKFSFDPEAVEGAFRAMTQFVCPGPISRSVADARMMTAVLLGREMKVAEPSGLRIAWCEAPEGKPVDGGVRAATRSAVGLLAEMGHRVEEIAIPTEGWLEAFGPLVLADEWRHRGHLLESAEGLTNYTRRAIETAETVTDEEVQTAKVLKKEFEDRIEAWFEHYDLIVTPTTATVAFPIGQRPRQIDQQDVGPLWGPFPFTAAFNVSGSPAASLPVGLADDMPVGLQVVGPSRSEADILNLCEQLEGAVEFPAETMAERWRSDSATVPPSFEADSAEVPDGLTAEYQDGVAVIRFGRATKRNALTLPMLAELRRALAEATERHVSAVVITGDSSCFSAGMDLRELTG
ncbi:MAG TPA: amidase family protein, partial [Solirubrobacterales bacterium]|nr:amidase family protein [Solirubrobacterales bacterium]